MRGGGRKGTDVLLEKSDMCGEHDTQLFQPAPCCSYDFLASGLLLLTLAGKLETPPSSIEDMERDLALALAFAFGGGGKNGHALSCWSSDTRS